MVYHYDYSGDDFGPSLNSATGVLSGILDKSGEFDFTITALVWKNGAADPNYAPISHDYDIKIKL